MQLVLEAANITKSFSGVRVLDGVCLQLRAGEVHAIMGENGAGKSTLMKILAGVHAPDAGNVQVNGEPVRPGNVHAALKAGVAMIYQELSPFLELSIAENMLMGLQPAYRFTGWIHKRAMHTWAAELLNLLKTPLPTRRTMRQLRVAEMQVVEIAKALAHRARVIIMDEPTSALSGAEAEALFNIIQELRQRGVAVVYISHKLDEIFRIADRITVLRDGRHVASGKIDEFTPERLIRLMVGRDLADSVVVKRSPLDQTLLEVRSLSKQGAYEEVSFCLRAGEILGLGGLMGAGRTEVVNGIFGLAPPDSGDILVRGKVMRIRRPKDALRAGIGLVTEDRKTAGLVPMMGIAANLTLAGLRRCCRAGIIMKSAERRVARANIQNLRIRAHDPRQPVESLSGGNQQKVVLGRTLFTEPDILLLDEPTRGIDVSARAEIHRIIRDLARNGKAVLLVSSEIPEILALSDRILVLRQGRVSGALPTEEATPEAILKLAMPLI